MLSVSSRNISNGAYETYAQCATYHQAIGSLLREFVVVSEPENQFQVSFDFRFMQIFA